MIPKIIHYCWFGHNPLPPSAIKCINSWKEHCPSYKIVEWNEDNFDINLNPYTKMCYEQKKYAFLTDYARLLIVENEGGIYFDTDVEVVKSFDVLLENSAFIGFETDSFVNTGQGFGAEPHNDVVIEMLKEYDGLLDGTSGVVGCPILNTKALLKYGLKLDGTMQNLGECMVYPADYFNPYDDPTGRLYKTKNTYSIHWYSKSWMSKKRIIRSMFTKPLHRLLGTNLRRRKL